MTMLQAFSSAFPTPALTIQGKPSAIYFRWLTAEALKKSHFCRKLGGQCSLISLTATFTLRPDDLHGQWREA